MKRFFYSVMAATTMLFATTSCSEDDPMGPEIGHDGKTQKVTFKVETPDIKSRVYSDGTTATVLQYAVYDANGDILNDLTELEGEIKGSTQVDLQLTTGNKYSVIFWAEATDAPYDVDFANKTMTVDYANASSNAENRDAFYAYHEFTVNGNQTETIELKRPFAQLNIGTNDYEASAKAGYTVGYSSVTVKDVYSTLNLFDGTVDGQAEQTFGLAEIPDGETFPVNGYDYLSMNYLLVSADQETVEIEFGYNNTDDAATQKTRTVGSVPVQRNYRTNIYGQLFTSDVDINVEIKPAYETPDNNMELPNPTIVKSWAEFTAALAAGASYIMLASDITYNMSYDLKQNVTIDLNGKSLEISDPTKMLNIGDSKNSVKPNVTITNGNLNCKVYALSGNVTIKDVVFGGTIAYVGASQGVINTKHANLLMDNCKMTNVNKSGSTKPRSISTEGRSSGYLILRNCNFKNSNLERPYINPLNGTATLELTDCALYGGASNIDLGASYSWTNMNLTGCSGGFTFTISRASTSLTDEEMAVYKAIKKNNSGSMRFIFSDGEKNNL